MIEIWSVAALHCFKISHILIALPAFAIIELVKRRG